MTNVVAEEASGAGVQLARLLILRARRSYLKDKKLDQVESLQSDKHDSLKDTEIIGLRAELSELRYVLTHIFRQLRRYTEAEARARLDYLLWSKKIT